MYTINLTSVCCIECYDMVNVWITGNSSGFSGVKMFVRSPIKIKIRIVYNV